MRQMRSVAACVSLGIVVRQDSDVCSWAGCGVIGGRRGLG
jgi:hypothetical protein